MPELPEVETIRRDLSAHLLGRTIASIEVRKPKMVRGVVRSLRQALVGKVVEEIRRRGKLLIFVLGDDCYLLVHLKMTGQLIFVEGETAVGGGHSDPHEDLQEILAINQLPNRYSHVILSFEDRSQLFFNDMRQFGYVRLVDERELNVVLEGYGVEPLTSDFTELVLADALKRRKTALKNVLLDQRRVAGLGNIYVDEASFGAGVRPTRRADRLTKEEVRRLYKEIRRILRLAVKERGTTFGAYRDGRGGKGNFLRLLKVYGRAGEQCLKCKKGIIKKTKVNGRGTSYCPVCQVR